MRRTTLGLIIVFALIAAACVAFGAYFSYVTLINAHRGVIEARCGIAAQRVVDVAEKAASLGIALPAQQALTAVLERETRVEDAIRSMDLTDEHGIVLYSSEPGRVGLDTTRDNERGLTRPVRNDIGQSLGRVVVRYDTKILTDGASALASDLRRISLPTLLWAGAATLVIGLLLAALLQRAVRRAAEPHLWPPAARAALASVEEAHRTSQSPPAGATGGGAA
ncbi:MULTISPECIES: hypothetical protein [Xanthobacter]|uniref:hypothetical protein n=1 Tax=Xanthobacter TaxID=279 RepID=UPI001E5E0C28|nr:MULTISPECIES: hypothetical protein [Xanthobacter]UDQ91438.1 hypothetical protein LJE71_10760 [Xanthobacter autotrophicus]UJX47044.1 hypothetical protein D7006_21615 [Xanthobacter sp. YC-JY1]